MKISATNKRELDKKEELHLIKEYINYLKEKGLDPIFESPIMSISNQQLPANQCMPDAILNGSWLELTTFTRCPEMRKQIGEQRKFPEKFESVKFIPGICPSKFQSLSINAYEAIYKKCQKDYSAFTKLAGITKKGTLLVMFVNEDPFFDMPQFEALIDQMKDQNFFANVDLSKLQFDTIILGAFVNNNNQWNYEFRDVLDAATINKINLRKQRKNAILQEMDDRC